MAMYSSGGGAAGTVRSAGSGGCGAFDLAGFIERVVLSILGRPGVPNPLPNGRTLADEKQIQITNLRHALVTVYPGGPCATLDEILDIVRLGECSFGGHVKWDGSVMRKAWFDAVKALSGMCK